MKHLSWKYRRRRNPKEQREFNAAQARRIAKRWEKRQEVLKDEPLRQSRVTELTIRDSHRPMEIVRIVREPRDHSWGRGRMEMNGKPVGRRAFGISGIARMLARSMA
jgi:hypothetical protein